MSNLLLLFHYLEYGIEDRPGLFLCVCVCVLSHLCEEIFIAVPCFKSPELLRLKKMIWILIITPWQKEEAVLTDLLPAFHDFIETLFWILRLRIQGCGDLHGSQAIWPEECIGFKPTHVTMESIQISWHNVVHHSDWSLLCPITINGPISWTHKSQRDNPSNLTVLCSSCQMPPLMEILTHLSSLVSPHPPVAMPQCPHFVHTSGGKLLFPLLSLRRCGLLSYTHTHI